jgi:hypothetical protein
MIIMLVLISMQDCDLNYEGLVIMDVILNNIIIHNIVIVKHIALVSSITYTLRPY